MLGARRGGGAALCNHYGTTETGMVSLDVAGRPRAPGGLFPASRCVLWTPRASSRVDAAGRVVVESRRGRIINVAGNKVDPREVELALLSLPGVREAAVVGRQRDAGTEEAWAFLVATPGTRADQVRRSLAASLSSTKLPRRLVMVDELPRTATGKVRLGVLLASTERPDEEERRE